MDWGVQPAVPKEPPSEPAGAVCMCVQVWEPCAVTADGIGGDRCFIKLERFGTCWHSKVSQQKDPTAKKCVPRQCCHPGIVCFTTWTPPSWMMRLFEVLERLKQLTPMPPMGIFSWAIMGMGWEPGSLGSMPFNFVIFGSYFALSLCVNFPPLNWRPENVLGTGYAWDMCWDMMPSWEVGTLRKFLVSTIGAWTSFQSLGWEGRVVWSSIVTRPRSFTCPLQEDSKYLWPAVSGRALSSCLMGHLGCERLGLTQLWKNSTNSPPNIGQLPSHLFWPQGQPLYRAVEMTPERWARSSSSYFMAWWIGRQEASGAVDSQSPSHQWLSPSEAFPCVEQVVCSLPDGAA